MLKKITIFLMMLISLTSKAQNFSALWEGHFSYYNIKDVVQGNDKIYAASENVIFSYDLTTNELQTITTIDGLSGESITTIEYSETYESLLIGYENGLIEIVSGSDNEVLRVVDIRDKETISPVFKRINHFNEHNGLVYISTDYGISVYDLDRLEFGDTYFIGNGGSQIIVKQTTIFNNYIYAACFDQQSIKRGSLDNPNLIDYQQWGTVGGGNFLSIQKVEDQLYTVNYNQIIYLYSGISDNFSPLYTYDSRPVDTSEVDGKLVITLEDSVFVYDSNFNLISNASVNQNFNTLFSSATISENHIYIGTSDFGVLQAELINPLDYIVIRPEGPLRNDAFKIEAGDNDLWVTYGDYDQFYNPYPLRQYGLSHFVNEEWNNIPYDSLLTATNLTYIAINPFNPTQVYSSAFFNGLLELNDDVATNLYDQNNSGLESSNFPNTTYTDLRLGPLKFDRNGLLWSMTCFVARPLKSYNPSSGQWQAYSFEEIIPNPIGDELGFSDLEIDTNGTKWTGSFFNGVIGYNENGNRVKRLYTQEQNMPSKSVKSLAIDNRNQLWIGTEKGLRVLYNTSNFFEEPSVEASEIVILDDGIPKELLSNQFITDIKVDGSNNKWIGTLDSGVFYFSPDGQQTIYHFTKDNSPLPSNTISDISIDSQNGRVYIATNRGLVSFLSGGSKPEDELKDAYVYPNPVRPEYNILGASDLNNINNGVKIKGLTQNVNIKITDIEGNLVAEAQSKVNSRASQANYNFAIDGGTAIWNGKNLRNNIVASGVYLILISDLDSFETKVLKLLIIR